MKRYLAIGILSLLMVGCKSTTKVVSEPVVSPTTIQTDVQDKTDPILPAYTPWWE
jgi:uncharacterized protein YcfL